MKLARSLALVGAGALIAGAVYQPERASANLLLGSYALIGLGLAAAFFIALQYATGSGWSTVFRRIPEAMLFTLPLGAAGIAMVMLVRPGIYPWTHEHFSGFKGIWLTRPFFLARTAAYLGIWMALSWAIIRNSRRQDADGDLAHTRRNVRLSVAFIVVFALTVWLASYDWIMSLEPDWASTIFGVYNFAGLFSSGLAAIILFVAYRSRYELRGVVNVEHYHDLGKLLFAFSTFWMYIWFSQYMLVWYADISGEASYFVRRLHGGWMPLFILNMLLNWAVPFLFLLPRGPKRSLKRLAQVAAVVLAGRWLDLYLMILPPVLGRSPAFGVPEIGGALIPCGLAGLAVSWGMRQAPAVPVQDPYLVESLNYHN